MYLKFLLIMLVFNVSHITAMTEQDDGSSVDWTKSILCQETTSEPLQCPGNSRRSDIECGTGYHTLASNIIQFSEIRSLPIPIDVEKLDEVGGIAERLMQRKAKFHKSWRNKFSNMKLKRADKRKRQGCVLAQPLPKPKKAAFPVEVPRKCFMKPRLLI